MWKTYIGHLPWDGLCYVCGDPIHYDNHECAHIVSVKNGGLTILENLRPTCSPCNKSCGSENLDDFKKKYFQK